MSGFVGMPPPKKQDLFQVVVIDDAVAERTLHPNLPGIVPMSESLETHSGEC